jgi:hypothetical protein
LLAVRAIEHADDAGEPVYIAYDDFPVLLELSAPIAIVHDRKFETMFLAVPEPGLRSLDTRDVETAASALRGACGRTATIVGVEQAVLKRVLRAADCEVVKQRWQRQGTRLPHDDVATVTFASGR